MNNKELGLSGELQAVKYLKKMKYKILECNAKNKLAEVDIIAMDKDCLVFIEVKSRNNDDFGIPIETVSNKQQRRYINFAKSYIVANQLANIDIRFDVISIYRGELEHIDNAFTQ